MKSKEYPEIGTVWYVRNKKAKKIILKITGSGEIRVSYPQFTLFYFVEKFVLSKIEWIQHKKQEIEKRVHKSLILDDIQNITKQYSLRFITISTDKHVVLGKIKGNEILISVSNSIEKSNVQVQNLVKMYVDKARKIEAKKYIPQRLHELAVQYNFSYQKTRISSARTRWGSCSGKNTISISFHIMKLPYHIIDFILIHELCHTIHKNHSMQFHNLLNECVGGMKKQFETELKSFSM